MRTINKLESEINRICDFDFMVTVNSKYKEKNVSVYMNGQAFKSTSTKWEGATEAVFSQIKGYMSNLV